MNENMSKDELNYLASMQKTQQLGLLIDLKDFLLKRKEDILKMLKMNTGIKQNKIFNEMGITNEILYTTMFNTVLDEEGSDIFLDAILEIDDLSLLTAVDRKDVEFFQNYFYQALKVATKKDQTIAQGGLFRMMAKTILSTNKMDSFNLHTDAYEKQKAKLKSIAEKMNLGN